MGDQRYALGVLPPVKRPGTHYTGGWVSPRAGLDVWGKAFTPPGFDPRTVQPVASRPPLMGAMILQIQYVTFIDVSSQYVCTIGFLPFCININ